MKKSYILKSGQAVNKEVVDNAISSYITNDITLKGSFFLMDKKENKPLTLSFAGLQKYSFGKIKDDVFYSCVDFVDGEGKKYDIDFFVRCAGTNNCKVIEMMVHKVDGKARYEWGDTPTGYAKQHVVKSMPKEIASSIIKGFTKNND